MDLIQGGHSIIIQKKNQTSVHELPKREGKSWTIKVGRNQVDLMTAIGLPYGPFRLVSGPSKKISILEPVDSMVESMKSELLKDISSGENNQDIWDDGKSQLLKKEDIDHLREQGISGSQIISQLLENSKSFQNKTEYAQEKYVNKKEGKYTEYVEIMRPSIRLLAKHFYTQDPMKILNLRPDSLALMMTLANIKAGGRYAVLDGGCGGLVLAAILDRIQGDGLVWNLYAKGKPQKQAVNAMNFTDDILKSVCNLSLFKLRELYQIDDEVSETPAKISRLEEEQISEQNFQEKLEFGMLDGLVIACRRPTSITQQLLKLVKPCGSFVLYCPYLEPLTETYSQLREKGQAVNLKLMEVWCRNYQVLPMRTHPEVMMSGSGGFILAGIHVICT